MNRKEMIADLTREAGCAFPRVTDIARWLGKSREYVRANIVPGLEYIGDGQKQFYANDVVDRVLRQRAM